VLDKTATIENFLEAAAAKQPTPGGGSVAALAGALAAAMGEMVLNYSVGKKGLEEHKPRLEAALVEFRAKRVMLLDLMGQDQSAYESLTEVRKSSADNPKRERRIAQGSFLCTHIPLLMAAIAVDILRIADGVVEIVNPYLLSDLAVCAELAMATTRAALYNVRVNLSGIADSKKRRRAEETGEQRLRRAVELIQRVIPRIWERVSKG